MFSLLILLFKLIMTSQEVALQSWRDEKHNYQKSARKIIADLCESIHVLPSSSFEGKLEELRQYLRYNYTYDQEENFLEVYVISIVGRRNMSVMELSHKLVEEIGGSIKFWQAKITDIAMYVNYHPDLSIWEANSFYEKYLGLPPQTASHLRKKKNLAKRYLSYLTGISKLIDRAKPFSDDLVKIDEFYLKLKKSSQQYHAFLEEIQNRNNQQQNISSKGIWNAKKNLFLFLKPKETKRNTLLNYNFKCRKSNQKELSKLLNGEQYQQLDKIFGKLKNLRRSRRLSPSGKNHADTYPIEQLRKQFHQKHKTSKDTSQPLQPHSAYIWSKQYFYSYLGHTIKSNIHFDYTSPCEKYTDINYEIDSQQQFDEHLAQDVDVNDSEDSLSLEENQNSFMVSDDHQSDREEDYRMKKLTESYFKDKWVKTSNTLNEYQMICLEPTSLPLPLQEIEFYQNYVDRVNGMSKTQIISLLDGENQNYSKAKFQNFLKTKFKKKRTKNKTIYIKLSGDKKIDSSEAQQSEQTYEISVNYAQKPQMSQINESNQTNIDDSVRSLDR